MVKHLLFIVFAFYASTVNLSAQNELLNFSRSECDDCCDLDRIQPRIISEKIHQGNFVITLGVVEDCAAQRGGFELQGDTLNLMFDSNEILSKHHINDKGEEVTEVTIIENVAFCDCFFEIEYLISEFESRPSVVTLNGNHMNYFQDMYKTYPIQFEIVKGDTLNFVDKYGFQQGAWKEQNDFEWTTKGFKEDNNWKSFVKTKYYDNEQVMGEMVYTKGQNAKYTFWYPSGSIMARIINGSPQCFNEKGKPILSGNLKELGYDLKVMLSGTAFYEED